MARGLSGTRMPVTPDFSVSQDDAAVVVRIRVPHVRVSEAEVPTIAVLSTILIVYVCTFTLTLLTRFWLCVPILLGIARRSRLYVLVPALFAEFDIALRSAAG